MSAWSKQAIPLIFLEITMNAIMVGNQDAAIVRRIDKRVQRWIGDCWSVVNNGKASPDNSQAQRKVQSAAASLKKQLDHEWINGIQSASEVTVAMCIIVSDTRDDMPKKHQGRRPWGFLLKALDELFLLTDPEVTDQRGYERGKIIAAKVLEAAR
ncbi:MAG: hypothetical protein RBR42_04895 [Desulfomicrobium sp.]|nr:hypothetical protein [Desulfomicrobium sp.]